MWGPFGGRIVFTRTLKPRDPWPRNSEIFIVNADGTGLKRLTRHRGIDFGAIFSPDGRQLVWGSSRAGDIDDDGVGPEYQLYIRNLVGPPNIRRITPPESYVWHYPEDWSPDGKRVLYSGCDPDFCWINSINSDGTDDRPLTDWDWFEPGLDLGMGDYSASWGPFGRRLVVSSNFNQDDAEFGVGSGILTMNAADGTARTVLLREGNSDFPWLSRPVWSPDGKQIVFTSDYPGGSEWNNGIYVMNQDGTGARLVTRGSANSWQRLRK